MDQGAIVLANLAKGRLGEEVAALLGSLLMSQLALAALSRVNTPEFMRREYFLYVDEAQLVATPTLVARFPEARTCHLGVILAHQYVEQLSDELRCALLRTVGSLLVFRLGGRDAEILAPAFAPEFCMGDLVNLPAHAMCLTRLVEGTPAPPCSATTFPAPRPQVSYRDRIIAATRAQYCQPVAEVERALRDAWHTPAAGDPPQQPLRFAP
jgi:hypothetical protein